MTGIATIAARMAGAIIALAAMACTPAPPADECGPYRRMTDDAANGFVSLRGAPINDPQFQSAPYELVFGSLVSLPGYSKCSVMQRTDMLLHQCAMVTSTESKARTVYNSSLAEARRCLSSWKPEAPNPDVPTPDNYAVMALEVIQGPADLHYGITLVRQIFHGQPVWRVTMMIARART